MSRYDFLSDPLLVAVLVAANLVAFLACMAIPTTLVWISLRTRHMPFPALWVLIGLFATGGALTRLVGALVFFVPAWYLEAAVCLLMAVISSMTAALLWVWRRAVLRAILEFRELSDEMERIRAWRPPEI